jgi:DNA polymerase-3 subunit delta'
MPFREIAGHHRLLMLLSRAVARQTLPPSLLLAGPRGVGKRTAAIAVAEALNCLQPATGGDFEVDACGACASCRRIARGDHPDILIVEPGDTGLIKIEQVRDVIDRAGYRPFEARRRVIVIDDADAMAGPAQNALLKTLEEPPSASVLLLITSMPDALLPTVLSRLQRLRFGPLTPQEVADVLIRSHDYADADARAAAADADGSVGRALESGSVDVAEARATAQRLLVQVMRITDPTRRLDAAKELTGKRKTSADDREDLAAILRSLATLLRDVGILASRADAVPLANADLADELRRLAAVFDSERTMRAFAAVDRALAALERNASPKVVADWLVLQL